MTHRSFWARLWCRLSGHRRVLIRTIGPYQRHCTCDACGRRWIETDRQWT